MLKKLATAVAVAAALALAACGTINNGAKAAGVDVTFANVYESAVKFQDKAYVTIRLYEATLDAAIFACDTSVNPDATKTPKEVCQTAAATADKLSPAVESAAHAIGTYVYVDGKVTELMASGKPVPAELLAAASEAFYKAQTEWNDVAGPIESYIGKK